MSKFNVFFVFFTLVLSFIFLSWCYLESSLDLLLLQPPSCCISTWHLFHLATLSFYLCSVTCLFSSPWPHLSFLSSPHLPPAFLVLFLHPVFLNFPLPPSSLYFPLTSCATIFLLFDSSPFSEKFAFLHLLIVIPSIFFSFHNFFPYLCLPFSILHTLPSTLLPNSSFPPP